MKKETVYFSNYLEELFVKFEKQLFSSLSLSSLIYVFVPSDQVKQWLMHRLVKEKKILAGLSFYTFSDLIPLFKKETFPDVWEIELALQEALLLKTSQNPRKEEERLWQFLGEKEERTKRIVQLSQKLAPIFFYYGLYGKELLSSKNNLGWQEDLWSQIFEEEKWKYPVRDLFSIEERSFEKNIEIHFFDLPFLPSLYREMIHRLSFQHPVFHYLLSPTFCFWEDLTSDRERRSLLQFWKKKEVPLEQREELDLYLQDRNPLLANFGKLGREALRVLDREDLIMEESYVLLERDSLLHSLQEDLLSLKNPASEHKEKVAQEDRSIQIHQATSCFREIEILHDFLLQVIQTEGFSFSEITVLAPDISLYEPSIHQVFGQGEIPYRISDLHLDEMSFFAKALRDFLGLIHSRWTKEDLLLFLENPLLLAKHPIDTKKLKGWIEKTELTWGRDGIHRSLFLETKKDMGNKGTWQDAVDRMIDGFVLSKQEINPFVPSFFFEKSDASTFDRFLFLFQRLKEDIIFLENTPFLSLEAAADYFEGVVAFYFSIDGEQKEEQKALSLFQEWIKKIRRMAQKWKQKKFSSEGLCSALLKKMQTTFSMASSSLEVVQFHSLKEGACLPSSVVCLLGMNEEFPRNEQSLSLNLLGRHKRREFMPSQNERDRALFLEAILSARETLYLSYSDASDAKAKRSLVLEELLSYINSRFSFEKNGESHFITIHPLFSFDRRYFEKESTFKSFSKAAFRASQSFYGEKRKEISLWEEELDAPIEECIDIKSLELLASHPIKFFFQKSLKIFLEEPKKETFLLSSLDRYRLWVSLMRNGRKELLDSIEKNSTSLLGMNHEIFKESVEKELIIHEENLTLLGVDKKTIFSVDMIDGCEEPYQKENGHWIAPALEVMSHGSKIKIVGLLDFLCPQGILYHGKGAFTDSLRLWPRLLIYSHFSFLEQGELLFTKTAKKKKILVDRPSSQLSAYLEYYEKAKKLPSPLLKEWAEPFFLGEKELQEAIVKKINDKRNKDLYFNRLLFLSGKPSSSFLQEYWKTTLLHAFAPLVTSFRHKNKEGQNDGSL